MADFILRTGCIELDSRDADGCTPLHHACEHGSTEVARLLIDARATVDIVDYNGVIEKQTICFEKSQISSRLF